MSSIGDDKMGHDVALRRVGSSTDSSTSHAHPPRAPPGFVDSSRAETDVDAAWSYLSHHRDAQGVSAVDLAVLRRKIDWRIVPLMFCCYTMQFLDKVILNVSSGPPPLVLLDLTPAPAVCRRHGHQQRPRPEGQ